jgi:parallel beta-helix repeat protein
MVESNSNPQVVNNVFWECGQCGIYITDGSEPVIVNNIIGKNEWGVSNEGNGEFRPRMEKNDLWENAMDYELMEKPPTDMGVKPQFAGPDTGNFHLMPGSPLLKAGKDGLNIGAYPTSP